MYNDSLETIKGLATYDIVDLTVTMPITINGIKQISISVIPATFVEIESNYCLQRRTPPPKKELYYFKDNEHNIFAYSEQYILAHVSNAEYIGN